MNLKSQFEAARAFQHAGDHQSAEQRFQAILRDVPNLGEAWANLAVSQFQLGKVNESVAALGRARALMPDRPEVALSRATMLNQLGRHTEAVEEFRLAFAGGANADTARGAFLSSLRESGDTPQLSDFTGTVRPEDLARWIVIACMPKSGSSFLKNALMRVLGWKEHILAFGQFDNEQELYLPAMVAHAREPGIVQQHFRATWPNTALLKGFGARPVVLVRNVFDALVSMADFYRGGAVRDSFLPVSFGSWEPSRQIDAVIDTWAPWYAGFHASWRRVTDAGVIDPYWIRYEDLIADKTGTLENLLEHQGISYDPARVAAAIDEIETSRLNSHRFNVGRAGRGAEQLTAAQRDRVRAIVAAHDDVDFAQIGL